MFDEIIYKVLEKTIINNTIIFKLIHTTIHTKDTYK